MPSSRVTSHPRDVVWWWHVRATVTFRRVVRLLRQPVCYLVGLISSILTVRSNPPIDIRMWASNEWYNEGLSSQDEGHGSEILHQGPRIADQTKWSKSMLLTCGLEPHHFVRGHGVPEKLGIECCLLLSLAVSSTSTLSVRGKWLQMQSKRYLQWRDPRMCPGMYYRYCFDHPFSLEDDDNQCMVFFVFFFYTRFLADQKYPCAQVFGARTIASARHKRKSESQIHVASLKSWLGNFLVLIIFHNIKCLEVG